MTKLIENSLSAVLAVAALSIGAAEVHREFSRHPDGGERRRSEYVSDWRAMLPKSRILGNPNSPITVIEFTDFQCPYCRRFNATLASLRAKYPGTIATALVQFPLPIHQQAEPAARVIECAATAGRLADAVDFVFAQQDSLGKKPWTWFAAGAGVADTVRFARCMQDSGAVRSVRAGRALGERAGVNATPTVLLNGWRYGTTPSDTELVRAVGDLMDGRRPYKGFPQAGVPTKQSRH